MKRKELNKTKTDNRNYFDFSFPVFVKTFRKELMEEYCEIDSDGFNEFCVYKYNKKLKNEEVF